MQTQDVFSLPKGRLTLVGTGREVQFEKRNVADALDFLKRHSFNFNTEDLPTQAHFLERKGNAGRGENPLYQAHRQ
jgi:hypothetical protein